MKWKSNKILWTCCAFPSFESERGLHSCKDQWLPCYSMHAKALLTTKQNTVLTHWLLLDTVVILKYSFLRWLTPNITRRSENDNTPQPLDQWTNSSFIGQQVGNCKSFTLTHYFADLSAMHRGRRSIPLCIQHHIQLTSLSFQGSQTSHCWVTAISIFYLENPRSRSWVRSKFEVTMWV